MNIYKTALLSQSACNLGALIHGWDRAITELQKQARENGKGTDWVNSHPVNVLFATQVAHLTACADGMNYARAYDVCEIEATRDTVQS